MHHALGPQDGLCFYYIYKGAKIEVENGFLQKKKKKIEKGNVRQRWETFWVRLDNSWLLAHMVW